jgi:hypothetical protein
MRQLGRSNLIGCQAVPADHMVILTCRVYTISVDFGLSIQYLVVPAGHTVILMCGDTTSKVINRIYIGISKFPKAMKANVPKRVSHL